MSGQFSDVSTYLILGKNDRVAAVAARGVGAPVVVDMLKEEYVFVFVNGSTILVLVISLDSHRSKV